MINAIKIEPKDNVVIVIKDIKKDENINFLDNSKAITIIAKDNIPIYHKVSIKDINNGENIVKYEEHIGKASKNISVGEHVHVHNVLDSRENLKE